MKKIFNDNAEWKNCDGGNDYYKGKAWYRKKLGKELIPEGFEEQAIPERLK